MNILEKLDDLHKQATVERSHHYVGSTVREAQQEISRLNACLMILWSESADKDQRDRIAAMRTGAQDSATPGNSQNSKGE